ncbi:MAG: hypothetical protein LM590_10980, partial [Thermofilum sp.]|nr:hypothetical protein [Thermofilum sp.]
MFTELLYAHLRYVLPVSLFLSASAFNRGLRSRRVIFVAFEGIDGAGLTTHARLTERFLESKGFKVVLTKEPTDGLVGGLIRACLRGEWRTDPMTLQLLFAADRSH